jgi:gamma-glutamyl:cysteine ligase YbdK (ATP-grasp superfamily)
MPDQPTDVALSAAFAALLQALCKTALDDARNGLSHARPGDYAQNRWSAARFGPRAKLIHPDGERYVPAAELGAELLELVRPAARELGSERLLDRIDPSACEADLQLQSETAEDAIADVVARSLG